MYNLMKLLCVVTVVIMIPMVKTDWLMDCSVCKCKWNSGKKTADCKNTALTWIPTNLSTEIQVLDLSNNFLASINANEFAAANLRNLHKLFIRNATLKQISRDSLKGLEILIELDLSFNLLQVLPRNIFNNLVKLRVLMLNNNKLERLEDGLFRNLRFLHKIELKENQLVRIETKAFFNLPMLTQIYLDGNQLTLLHRESFHHLDKLTGLSLKQNPWNCTCELRPFRDFAFDQNLYTPPTDCYHPENLRGTLWTDVSLDAFSCRPKIQYPVIDKTTISSYNENATIVCRIQASPSTIISWSYNKHALSNYPKRIFIKNTSESSSARDSNDIITSELTIVGVRRTDEGIYTCTAQNIGGRTEIDIQLLVGRDSDGIFSLTNQMLFVLCLMAVGLLIASIVIMIVTCCYCRRFKILIKHDLDNDHYGISVPGISLGADGTLNGNNSKKHFQAIKLNSFNNATMIGNGNCIAGNSMVSTCATDCVDDAGTKGNILGIIANINGDVSIDSSTNCDKEKYLSNKYIHSTNIKSEMVFADTHNTNKSMVAMIDKKATEASENQQHQNMSSQNRCIMSPTRKLFASANEQQQQQHQLHDSNQQSLQRHADSRLPPDLLQYGQQHHSLSYQHNAQNNSIYNSIDGTSTESLDNHRNQINTNNGVITTNKKRSTFIADRIVENDDDDDNKFLSYAPDDEPELPDLRIYHDDNVKKPSKSYAVLHSKLTSSLSKSTSKRMIEQPSSNRNIYEISPSSTIISNTNFSSKHFTKPNAAFLSGSGSVMAGEIATTSTIASSSRSSSPKIISNNTSGSSITAVNANCKLRQSVVRTSSSYNFLPTGYHPDNFL